MAMTHRQLCERARTWLQGAGRCSIAFVEFVTTLGEIPDAIGFRNSGRDSVLIECKASCSDFLRDRHKRHRQEGIAALGSYRYYMCEPNVIRVEDLPPRWGLLWAKGRSVTLIAGADPARSWWPPGTDIWRWEAGASERVVMFSALRRLQLELGVTAFRDLAQKTITQKAAEAGKFRESNAAMAGDGGA